MKLRQILLSFYRVLQSRFVKQYLLPFWIPKHSQFDLALLPELPDEPTKKRPIWFHAASVGELECILPLIQMAAKDEFPLILTILSPSAQGALDKLKTQLEEARVHLIFVGPAPWEGEWKTALIRWKPTLFLTAKYEAWPDLWISLQQEKVPLVIVSARARKSLRLAQWFCEKLGFGLPELLFFSSSEKDIAPLRQLIPGAKVAFAGEPRWDRVSHRARLGNPRAQSLIDACQSFKRPWGMLGSVWMEDLHFLKSFLSAHSSDLWSGCFGTLWLIPHQVDPLNLEKIERFLRSLGVDVLRSSRGFAGLDGSSNFRCVLVDEMGVLSELYSEADWVWVGGGFGVGIHSTIEPALYGAPIAVGPNGMDHFSEVAELLETGQLKILRTASDLHDWAVALPSVSPQIRLRWRQQAQFRLGATQRIWSVLEEFFGEKFSGAC